MCCVLCYQRKTPDGARKNSEIVGLGVRWCCREFEELVGVVVVYVTVVQYRQ